MKIDPFQRLRNMAELGKYDLVEQEARHILEQNPNQYDAYNFLALALWRTKRPNGAIKALRTGLSLRPDEPYTLSYLALILDSQKKHKEAKLYHERAIALKPETALFHVRYAESVLPKDWRTAMKSLETTLKLAPGNLEAYLVRGKALRLKRHYHEAEESLLQALQLSPNNSIAYEYLGDVFWDRRRFDEALAAYRQALRINPVNRNVKRKIVLALQARIPIIGTWLWIFSETLPLHQGLIVALAFNVSIAILCGISVVTKEPFWAVACLFGFLFLLVLKVVCEAFIVRAITKGWIKI